MRSSSIYIKFQSEAEFERLTFPSQVVSYDEIKKHLEKKKKIVFADKKTDRIVLMDINRSKEIQEGFVEANTRVVVMRTPIVTGDPIELTYNPRQTGGIFDKHGGKVRLEGKSLGNALASSDKEKQDKEKADGVIADIHEDVNTIDKHNADDNANKDADKDVKSDLPNVIKFITQKINLSTLGKEFMCPLPNFNEKKPHLIIDPVILSCCGTTCCLECIVKIFNSREVCPFCSTNLKQKSVKIFPNLPLQRLFDQELLKVENQLSPEEKERLLKIQANMKLQEQILKMPKNIKTQDILLGLEGKKDANQGSQQQEVETDPILLKEQHLQQMFMTQKDQSGQQQQQPQISEFKNPLFEMMQNARFIMIKAPNHEFIMKGVTQGEWCFTQKTLNVIKNCESQNLIFFVSIKDSNCYQGAFSISNLKDLQIKSATESWLSLYPAQYDGVLDVQWQAFTDLPYSKTKNLVNQLRENEPLNKFRDGEEVHWDLGSSLCKLILDQEKLQTQQSMSKMTQGQNVTIQNKFKQEYILNAPMRKQSKNQQAQNPQQAKQPTGITYTQEEQDQINKIMGVDASSIEQKDQDKKEPTLEDINMMFYEDIASPSFFNKSSGKDKTLSSADRRIEKDRKKGIKEEETKGDIISKTAVMGSVAQGGTTITVPMSGMASGMGIQSHPGNPMFRPPYNYYPYGFPGAAPMMQPGMYPYAQAGMMIRPGMMAPGASGMMAPGAGGMMAMNMSGQPMMAMMGQPGMMMQQPQGQPLQIQGGAMNQEGSRSGGGHVSRSKNDNHRSASKQSRERHSKRDDYSRDRSEKDKDRDRDRGREFKDSKRRSRSPLSRSRKERSPRQGGGERSGRDKKHHR
eukprot:403359823